MGLRDGGERNNQDGRMFELHVRRSTVCGGGGCFATADIRPNECELWLYSRNQTARLKEYYDRLAFVTGMDDGELHIIGPDGPHPITIKYASDDLGLPDRVIDNNLHRKRARE